eukprot:UN16331
MSLVKVFNSLNSESIASFSVTSFFASIRSCVSFSISFFKLCVADWFARFYVVRKFIVFLQINKQLSFFPPLITYFRHVLST